MDPADSFNKKAPDFPEPLVHDKVLILSEDFLFVICSTVLAHSVRKHEFAALGTFHQIHGSHLPVSAPLIPVSLG